MATLVSDMLTWVGYRLFPDGSTTITASSEPNQSECLQWINEVCNELLTVCVTTGSEIGRSSGSITTEDGESTYTDLAALMFAPVLMYDKDGKQFSGYIEKTNVRNPLRLVGADALIDEIPSEENEPTMFTINGANGIQFFPQPDDEYTAVIPYYPYHTILTLTTNTIPFMQIFDNVILESVVMRAQNREEYDLSYELKWFSYIRSQAKKILYLRKNPTTRIMF